MNNHNPGEEPGTTETHPWSEHPFTGTLAEARALVEEAAGLPAAVLHGVRAAPEVIEAAVRTLALPPDDRCVSVIADPAAVWDINGTMTAVYSYQTPDGPVTGSWCGCAHWDGPCEHLLIALAGTRQPESSEEDEEDIAAFEDFDGAIEEQFPELTPAERNRAANIVLHDAARQIRSGRYVIVSRPDKLAHAVWDDEQGAEFTRLRLSRPNEKQPED